MQRRGLLSHAVIRTHFGNIEAGVVLERFEWHVLLMPLAAGLKADDPVDREHSAMSSIVFGGLQAVLILFTVQANGYRIVGKQIDNGGAIQAHVVQGGADMLRTRLVNIETQLQAPGLDRKSVV